MDKVNKSFGPKTGEVKKNLNVTILSMGPAGKVTENIEKFSKLKKILKAEKFSVSEPRPLDLNSGRVMIKARGSIDNSKVRFLGDLKVPANKVAPKRVVPKVWSDAPQSKKMRSIKCALSKEGFFLQEGSGRFTQAQRDLYEARKKFTAISVENN